MKIPVARYWALLAQYLRDKQLPFFGLFALILTGIGFKLLVPQVTREFIESAQAAAPLSALVTLALVFIGVALAAQLIVLAATWLGETLAWDATNALRIDLARHCLHLDMEFHKRKTPGEMIERLDEDISAMARFFSQLALTVFSSLILMIGILILLAIENLMLGAAFAVFSGASLYALLRLRELALPFEVKRRAAIADIFAYLEERLTGTEDVRSSGAVGYVINGLYRLQSNLFVAWENVQFRYWLLGVAARVITVLGYVLAFVAGYYLHDAGTINLATAFMIVHYMNLLARPLRDLSAQVEGLQAVGASIERIEELLSERRTILDPEPTDGNLPTLPGGALSLAFDEVTFDYELPDGPAAGEATNTAHEGERTTSARPVLNGVSFALPAGQVVGVLGRTGSGKTTLARLVFRLYDAQSGAIRLAGVRHDTVRIGDLRARVAMVTQDVQLFQASVRDNLTFFSGEVADERLLEVLDQVELKSWLARLPHGLDTRLDSGGRSMSAGEAQLLAFARVFLLDPGLVILDEASSRLDPATELRIERAMDRLLAGRTGLIIAHRLGTVRRADRILILEDGEVVESGERRLLEQDPGSRFARLLAVAQEQDAGMGSR